MNPTIDTKELRRKISEAQFIRDNAVPVVTLTEDDARGLADTIDRLAADLAKARVALEEIATQLKLGSTPQLPWHTLAQGAVYSARRTLAEIAP